ncbi:hypothetical protein HanHA300_Chr02g0065991 [Helianthus annuus]|nr:hypothetical protein HanHA300_Chr02g0065991 [Helianthus annuus]
MCCKWISIYNLKESRTMVKLVVSYMLVFCITLVVFPCYNCKVRPIMSSKNVNEMKAAPPPCVCLQVSRSLHCCCTKDNCYTFKEDCNMYCQSGSPLLFVFARRTRNSSPSY